MSNSVWETLSVIDCNAHTEEKGGFTYLSWAWAWKTLKEHYPEARFEKLGHQMLDDETAMVAVRVWIPSVDGGFREDVTEVLPVLDYKNKAVQNPNCFEINSAYQRCLVKCLAYMGLGMYIYQGEKINPDAPVLIPVINLQGEVETLDDMTAVANILITFIEGNDKDIETLRKYWASNKQALDHLQQFDPKNFERVKDTFMNVAEGLKGDDQ